MPAQHARSLLEQFFDRATREHMFRSSSLSVMRGHPIGTRFAEILNVPLREFMHERLSLEQSSACLEELVRAEAATPADARAVMLAQHFEISKWNMDGEPVNTRSTLTMRYGGLPCLTTRLWFETEEEFNYIRDVMGELGLCKLNKQHLKLMKRPVGWGGDFCNERRG
jgi:hypothetical protein